MKHNFTFTSKLKIICPWGQQKQKNKLEIHITTADHGIIHCTPHYTFCAFFWGTRNVRGEPIFHLKCSLPLPWASTDGGCCKGQGCSRLLRDVCRRPSPSNDPLSRCGLPMSAGVARKDKLGSVPGAGNAHLHPLHLTPARSPWVSGFYFLWPYYTG